MNLLITRAAEQLANTVNTFSSHGISSYCMPLIAFKKQSRIAFRHKSYDYCVLTSPSAAEYFAETLREHALSIGTYAAVGEKTAQAIEKFLNVPSDKIIRPEAAYMDDLLKLLSNYDLQHKKILAPGPKERIADAAPFFESAGADFDKVNIYETVPVIYEKDELENFIKTYRINIISFFSPSAVSAFFAQAVLPDGVKVAAVGKSTAKELEKRHITALIPAEQSAESMAELIKRGDI